VLKGKKREIEEEREREGHRVKKREGGRKGKMDIR
jgi:hypothetical protein